MAKTDLTAARVRELLDYNPDTGIFCWRSSKRGSVKAGDEAGFRRGDGYIKIKIDQHAVWAHRLVWLYVHGVLPAQQIDHINGNPSDNRLSNLRDVSGAVNSQNERKARRRKLGGTMLGAHWCATWRRWKSAICIDGKARHIGWFDTEADAHAAYVAAKRQLHEGCTI